ncbi:MAG: PEP-CTERM sorting domain-containing protein [Oceanicoccus sp.]
MKNFKDFLVGAGLLCMTLMSYQVSAYVVGGASSGITGQSGCWAWNGSCVDDFRAALETPEYFGPTGVVDEVITTVTLDTVDATSLAGVDMFIAPWVGDSDGLVFSEAVVDFFLSGGDLFLLQDDANHDVLGTMLGISTTASSGAVSNGGAPLYDGPFGVASDVNQYYLVGQLDATEIADNNGRVGGTNEDGQITAAYWAASEYAVGAGSLFVVADIDMIATTTGCRLAICGGDYALTAPDVNSLNNNAIYGLNVFSFLKDNGGTSVVIGDEVDVGSGGGNGGGSVSVPEPSSILLLGLGLAALGARRKLS